ncbi:hydantoinase B/oxoprolinase family protein, partial [Candidatus Bipolaricaulota bacterium]|nr:hydantoinase B/oxoprolinase family protein [Candidatus Bipolaricaulota bacterium]
LAAGEVVSFQTGGGGGYGSPHERDPKKVLKDVANGYVSLERAKEEYGVIIDEATMKVDGQATEELRNKMKNDH